MWDFFGDGTVKFCKHSDGHFYFHMIFWHFRGVMPFHYQNVEYVFVDFCPICCVCDNGFWARHVPFHAVTFFDEFSVVHATNHF